MIFFYYQRNVVYGIVANIGKVINVFESTSVVFVEHFFRQIDTRFSAIANYVRSNANNLFFYSNLDSLVLLNVKIANFTVENLVTIPVIRNATMVQVMI